MNRVYYLIKLNRLTAAAYEPIDYQGNVRAVISQNGALERSSTSRLSEPSPVRGDR